MCAGFFYFHIKKIKNNTFNGYPSIYAGYRNWMSKNIDASVSALSTVSCRVRHSDCAQYVCNLPTEF